MRAWPDNLTDDAIDELEEILAHSLRWGVIRARKTAETLRVQIVRIGQGLSLGHKRRDIPTEEPLLFHVVRPFVIVYNPETRMVVHVFDGRRDLTNLVR